MMICTNRRQTFGIVLAAGLFGLPLSVEAVERHFTMSASLTWGHPLNWSPPGIPLPDDRVVIGEAPFFFSDIVQLDVDATVAELSILRLGSLRMNGQRLEVNGLTSVIGTNEGYYGPVAQLDIARATDGTDTADLVTQGVSVLAGGWLNMSGGILRLDDGLLHIDQTSLLLGHGVVRLLDSTSDFVLDNHGEIRAEDTFLNITSENGGRMRLANASGTVDATNSSVAFLGEANDGSHLLEGEMLIGGGSSIVLNETLLVDGATISLRGTSANDVATLNGTDFELQETFLFAESGGNRVAGDIELLGDSVIGLFPDASLVFENPVTFSGSGNTVDNPANLTFKGGLQVADSSVATFDVSGITHVNNPASDGSATSMFGDTRFTGSGTLVWWDQVNVDGEVVVDNESFFWIGDTSITPNSSLTINTSRLSSPGLENRYAGMAVLATDSVLSVNTDVPWRLAGTLEMQGATVNGVPMTVGTDNDAPALLRTTAGNNNRINSSLTVAEGGSVVVEGGSTLILQDEARFESGGSITVDGTLRPQAFTRYRGGMFMGGGTIDQNGTARFIENTEIDLDRGTGVYNMDGIGVPEPQDTHITVNPDVAVAIRANRINTANNEFGGGLLLDSGILIIDTESPWTMAGNLEMRKQSFADPSVLDGSPVIISGELHASGELNFINPSVTFESSAEVSVPDGTLTLFGSTLDFFGGSFTGGGTISPQESDAIRFNSDTTLEVGAYILDGGPTTVLADAHLVLDVGAIDRDAAGNNRMDSSLTLFGGDVTVQQSEHEHWIATSLSHLLFSGLQNTPDLNGQPVAVYGRLSAEDGLSRINVPVTFGPDPDAIQGAGVPTATVQVDAGAELEFNETVTIEGGDFDGDGTLIFNKATTIGGIVNASIGGIRLGEESSLTITGGHVRPDNFEKHADAELDLEGGFLAVVRGDGTFNSGFAFGGGTDEFSEPVFAVQQGAEVEITRGWTIAENEGEFGRTQVASVSIDGTRRSTLRGTQPPALGANLIVGRDGTGSLFVQGGGLVQMPGVMVVGSSETGSGTVLVEGVQQGHRAEIDVRHNGLSDILVGGTPNLIPFAGRVSSGELSVLNGGLVRGSGDLIIAPRPGSEGTVSVGGHEAGFDAEIILEQSVFVGGNATQNGGDGILTINEGGSLTAKSMFIRGPGGLVEMTGGELHLEMLNTTFGTGGEFSLTGGVVAVDEIVGDLDNEGGTISPGDSPGVMMISGSYSQGTDAALLIELGGTLAGDEYDQLRVGGTAALGGTLEVHLYDNGSGPFSPSDGDAFEIVTAGDGIEGTFDEVLLPELQAGIQWNLSYGEQSVLLEVLAALLDGDYNNNSLVEQQDLDLVLANWGDDATVPPAGWVNDLPEGNIDQTELDGVLANWGNAAILAGGAGAVPEPNAMAMAGLLIAGAIGGCCLRNRRRRSE